jgi:uncharacterized membrane protein YqiK
MRDAVTKGRMARGQKNSHAKLTEQEILRIRQDNRQHHIIAKEYGLNWRYVGQIKKKQHWKHVI